MQPIDTNNLSTHKTTFLMIRKCNLLALALGFALSMNSCHLLHNGDDEDPKPQTHGRVKGSITYGLNRWPMRICETPTYSVTPTQANIHFTKDLPNLAAPVIFDSTASDANGNFEKELPEGKYYLLVSVGCRKYVSPSPPNSYDVTPSFSFEVKAADTTEIQAVVHLPQYR